MWTPAAPAADGKLIVSEKARGRKASIQALLKHYSAALDFGDAQPAVFISHAGAPEEAAALADAVQQLSPAGTEVYISELSPIIGAHTGPDMLAVCHYGTHR